MLNAASDNPPSIYEGAIVRPIIRREVISFLPCGTGRSLRQVRAAPRPKLGFVSVSSSRGDTFETRSMINPSGVVVTLMRHDEPVGDPHFDERRIGLDHLAFEVADEELQRWVEHLDTKGVPHSHIVNSGWGPTVTFRNPDNIQLEFFVHPIAVDEARPNTHTTS
jgi:catechol 2,3-dioxygenase-like lactoylglutathione lyase family enzyme